MYDVYILKSDAGKIYVGHTMNLKNRMSEHQKGENFSTKGLSDLKLIYSEQFPTRSLAMKREKFFKTGDGRKALRSKGIID